MDSFHTATTTSPETLNIVARDNFSPANSVQGTTGLTLEAGALTDASNLNILLARGPNDITTGDGVDNITLLGNYDTSTPGKFPGGTLTDPSGTGVDVATLHNNIDGVGPDNTVSTPDDIPRVVTDAIDTNGGADVLNLIGAIDTTGATINFANFNTVTSQSALVITADQLNDLFSAGGTLDFIGDADHGLTIEGNLTGGGSLDLSQINLEGSGDLTIVNDAGVTLDNAVNEIGTGSATVDAPGDPGVPDDDPSVIDVTGSDDAVSGDDDTLRHPTILAIFGAAGTEQVTIFDGVTGATVASSVERVDLPGDIADFTFSSFGNSLTIHDASDDVVAQVSDAGGKQVVFGNGALDAAFDAGTLTLGGETPSTDAGAPTAITPAASEIDTDTPTENINDGPVTDGPAARVFLADGRTFNAASDSLAVFGAAGTEQVTIFDGVTGVTVASSVERVDLPGDIAEFTFSSFGNSLTIHDASDDVVAQVSDAGGKQVVFGNGALDAAFDAGTLIDRRPRPTRCPTPAPRASSPLLLSGAD